MLVAEFFFFIIIYARSFFVLEHIHDTQQKEEDFLIIEIDIFVAQIHSKNLTLVAQIQE